MLIRLTLPLLLLIAPLTAVQAADTTLRITTFGLQGPMEAVAVKRLEAAYQKLHIKLELVPMPGKRALASSNAGQTDGELLRRAGLGESYPNLLAIKVPIVSSRLVGFSQDKSTDISQGWASLKTLPFSYERGTSTIERNTAGFATATPESDIKSAFAQLMRQHIAVVVVEEHTGLTAIKQMGIEHSVHQLEPPLIEQPLFHYLNKQHAALIPQLEAALQQNP